MASSGPYCLKWTIDRSLTLQLLNGTVSESNSDVIVDWFESDRQTETKYMKPNQGQFPTVGSIQLQIPTKGTDRRKVLAEKLDKLFDEVNKDYSSIAFQLGQHKVWDTDALLSLLLSSLKLFAKDNKSRKLKRVIICEDTRDRFNTAEKQCEDSLACSGSSRQGSLSKPSNPITSRPMLNVNVKQGCLEEITADVVVCIVHPDLFIPSVGAVGAINRKSNGQLQRDLNEMYKDKKFEIGDIAVVKRSGNLLCNYVLVGALSSDHLGYGGQKYEDLCRASLKGFMMKCLQKVQQLRQTSVAFSAIGTGVSKYPVKIVVDQMFESVRSFESDGTIKKVTFVIYKLEQSIFKEFQKAEQKLGSNSAAYKDTALAETVKKKTSLQTNARLTGSKLPEDKGTNVVPKAVSSSTSNLSNRLNENTSSRQGHFSRSFPSSGSYLGAGPITLPRQSSFKSLKTFTTLHRIHVNIYQCNEVDTFAECLCIAATKDNGSSHIAKEVNAAAGMDLSACAKAKLKTGQGFKVGGVCETDVGHIRGKQYILHTVVPDWDTYKPFSEGKVKKCETEFHNCIFNSLTHAEGLGLKTLAFSPMSVGLHKVPNDLCAAMYVAAVVDYDKLSRRPLKEIHFVHKDENELRIIEGAFYDVLQMKRHPSCYNRAVHIIRDSSTSKTGRYHFPTSEGRSGRTDVETRTDESRKISDVDRDWSNPKMIIYPYWHVSIPPNKPSNEFTCWFNKKQKLYVYTGDITSLQNIEMIVCNEKPNGKGEGKLAKALGEKLGSSYKKSKETEFKRNVKPGDVIVCSSIQGILKPKWIAHAVLYWKTECNGEKDRKKKVEDIFTSIFDQASAKGCKSIALPVLGSGKGNADPEYYTERLFFSLLNFCDKTKHRDIFVHLVNIRSTITDTAIATVKKAVSKSPNLNQSLQPKAISEPRKPERPKGSARKDSTNKHHGTIHKENRESKQPDPSSNIPAATSSHRARQPIQDTTEQTEAEMPPKPNSSRTGNVQIYIDDDDDKEIPSKSKERDKDSNERTINSEERDNGSNSGYSEDDDDNSYVQRSDSDEENDEGASCQAKDSMPNKTEEICVICMETVKKPRTLPCEHVFCEDCIEQQFTYKEACPTCGRVVGTIEGDQPDGTMTITIDDFTHCAGFEREGQIIITYSFENGKQGPSHPNPGAIYKGITRKAFLPKNEHGKRICKMLWVAFKRRLVFTVGSSRTTGKEGVITWNDIHHKTDPKPNSQFGYPDDSYLDRVTDELKAKGVTEDDIVDTSFEILLRRCWRPRR